MSTKRRKATMPGSESPAAESIDLPERWSAQRKTELVLRLLRGEALEGFRLAADPVNRRLAPVPGLLK